MLTQGVASRPVALADQPLQQAEEQQGRVVWSHGREDAQDGADEGGGEEAHFAAKPSEARDSEVRPECSQGQRDSRPSAGRRDRFSAASCSPSRFVAPSQSLTWSPLSDSNPPLLQV